MSHQDPKTVFAGHLTDAIARFEADRNRHKRLALVLKMATSALGATAAVLLGWQDPGAWANSLKNAALVATTLVTLFAAYDAFFEPRQLWVQETLVLNSLRDLKRHWEIATASAEPDPPTVAAYSDRLHEVLTKSLKDWVDGKRTK